MDYKHSKMLGDDYIRIPFNCDQGFEEYYLIFVGKTPYENERHLDKVVCARCSLTEAEHARCKKTLKDVCWKDEDPAYAEKEVKEVKHVVKEVKKAKK